MYIHIYIDIYTDRAPHGHIAWAPRASQILGAPEAHHTRSATQPSLATSIPAGKKAQRDNLSQESNLLTLRYLNCCRPTSRRGLSDNEMSTIKSMTNILEIESVTNHPPHN